MSQTLNIANFNSINIDEPSNLSADTIIGATTCIVENPSGYTDDDYVIIGRLASETSELAIIDSIASNTLTLTAGLARPHSVRDTVTKLFGNKIKIYRAANTDGSIPADIAFSVIATVDMDTDQQQTKYTDSAGSSSYWYKYTYFNSTSSAETSLSDSRALRGGGFGNYCSIESIRAEAGIRDNRYISDARVDEKRQAAQSLIHSQLIGIYAMPFTSPVSPLIAQITRTYAAGLLLTDNYGPVNTLNTNEGQQKLDSITNAQGTGLLDKLRAKTLILTDPVTGTDTSTPGTAGSFGGYPDSSGTGYGSSSKRAFRMSDEY